MMLPHRKGERRPAKASRPAAVTPRWLLFLHQLPGSPSNLRVRTWRRLQQIGALPIGQALYALPDSPNAREDFEWLKTEIQAAGGQAHVFAADAVDSWSNDALIEQFRRSREESYNRLARDADQVLKRLSRRSRAELPRRVIQPLKERLAAIEQVDFFGSAGRDRVIALVQQIEQRATADRRGIASVATTQTLRSYTGRTWVTRPRPGVDRMASAWLIQRFIDTEATFGFAADRDAAPSDAIPFDMFGVEFSHQGDGCTFETLCSTLGITEPAVGRLAQIVHDLDLKDGRYGAPEAAAVGIIIEGLQLAHVDDQTLLAQGMALFDSLYRAFDKSTRSTRPRVLAKPRQRTTFKRAQTSRHRRAR
jgi:hypothetical protein